MQLSIIPTRKALTARVIMESFARDPKTKTAQRSTNRNNNDIQQSEGNLPRRREPQTLIHKQPKDPTQAIRKPTSKERRDQAEQVTKHGNRSGNNPRHGPQRKRNTDPRARSDPVTLVHAVRTLENTQVDILERDVAVDDTGDDDSRQRDAVRDFRDHRRGGAQRWRSHVVAGVPVDY